MLPPLDLLRQRDDRACETTVAMQLLYRIGKLKTADFNKFDRCIGRRRGRDDSRRNSLKELLNAGFLVTIYSDCDREQIIGPHGLEYLQEYWRKKGKAKKP